MNPTANLIWGAAAIAAFLGKTERATYHMLELQQIPGAVKVGNQWTLAVDVFRRKIEEAAA
jgi:hypothetical protein